MESVWWVFKTLWEKNLVYRSFKVMPYSTACNTPLSNFEANLNYKEDTVDPAVVVSFPIIDDPDNAAFLAWTTTPWTLPSNLALCVHPTLTYVRLRDAKTKAVYIVSTNRIVQLFNKYKPKKSTPPAATPAANAGEKTDPSADLPVSNELFDVLAFYKGSELVGKKYTPLFRYFEAEYGSRAFTVVSDTYVTDDAGTGIVHQSPAFGEDDWRVCVHHGIIDKDSGRVPCPVDANGRFTSEVPEFQGAHVKEADDAICALLKQQGRLISKGVLSHSYPFCWRSDTPLIYRAVPSWFIRVEDIKEDILKNNDETYWVPENVRAGRFANWLRDARDWAVSRNRYWGTPIPIWADETFSEMVCIGSIEELALKSGVTITDLHRESIDHITIPSSTPGNPPLRRIDEVFDCWFESGSMPYAQVHYPFNKEVSPKFLEERFPADFIAEGLDQTRGWFYTLMVLSTALFNKPAFKNLIVNGLVLAEDGKKMSKRLKNYPDPMLVVSKYGADALRLYLIDSPVVKSEPLKFREAGVLGVVKDLFLPWYNALRFLSQHIVLVGPDWKIDDQLAISSTNSMDRWVYAAVQGLIQFVRKEMAAYRLYTVVPRLVKFIHDLTNWYVRLNRRRIKGVDGVHEQKVSLSVLHGVLLNLARLMSPFTPFLSEMQYQVLKPYMNVETRSSESMSKEEKIVYEQVPGSAPSIHFISIPDFDLSRVDLEMEVNVGAMQGLIESGRTARERRHISLKTPVQEVIIVHSNEKVLAAMKQLEDYVVDELNALKITYSTNEQEWMTLSAVPDTSVLGKRLGQNLKKVVVGLKALSHADILKYQVENTITIDGIVLSGTDVIVKRDVKANVDSKFECGMAVCGIDGLLIAINTVQDETTKGMGLAREVVNRIQKLRKSSGLVISDVVEIFISVSQLSEEEFKAEFKSDKKTDEEEEEGASSSAPVFSSPAEAETALRSATSTFGQVITDILRQEVFPMEKLSPEAALFARAEEVVAGAKLSIALVRRN
jgi:isoleucyl-tRNA synthetase